MTTSVRVVIADDLDAIGAVLARAYADDPVWTWVYPQPDRSRRLARMFRSLLRATRERGGLTDQATRGAAIWQRSDDRSLGALGNLRMGAAIIASGARIRRSHAVMRAIERRHPHEPHWYLAVLGTDPAHQGVGSALVRHVLDDPANTTEPAYLETEIEANVPFYQRHGFEVIGQLDVPRGGPHLWLMWREPHEPSRATLRSSSSTPHQDRHPRHGAAVAHAARPSGRSVRRRPVAADDRGADRVPTAAH